MKKKTISIIATMVLAFGCLGTAMAAPSDRWSSKGIILFPGPDGTEGTADDIKFDSSDLDTIYNEVADGKTAIANAIKNDAGLNLADPTDTVSNIYTFQELVTGVNPWDDIASGVGKLTYDSSTGTYSARTTQSPEYASVNSIESLDQAIARDNVSYSTSHIEETMANNASIVTSLGYSKVLENTWVMSYPYYGDNDSAFKLEGEPIPRRIVIMSHPNNSPRPMYGATQADIDSTASDGYFYATCYRQGYGGEDCGIINVVYWKYNHATKTLKVYDNTGYLAQSCAQTWLSGGNTSGDYKALVMTIY